MSADPDERFNETCPPATAAIGEADRFPVTCSWCLNSPATHLLIWDCRPDGETFADRHREMICGSCGHGQTVLPGEVTGWWLFRLVPDDTRECDVPAPDETAATAGEGNDHD